MSNQKPAMRCKLVLHDVSRLGGPDSERASVRFGAVWEGSSEAQSASENAVFGNQTPYAEFNATVCNPNVINNLVTGKAYIVTFTEAEQQ